MGYLVVGLGHTDQEGQEGAFWGAGRVPQLDMAGAYVCMSTGISG